MIQSIASTDRAVDRRRRNTVENRNATDGAGSDDGGHTESYLPYVFVNPNLCNGFHHSSGKELSICFELTALVIYPGHTKYVREYIT